MTRIAPIILIVVGVLFLLNNMELLPIRQTLHKWWPLILIVIGVSLLFSRGSRK